MTPAEEFKLWMDHEKIIEIAPEMAAANEAIIEILKYFDYIKERIRLIKEILNSNC